MSFLSLRGVTAAYGERVVVDRLSLEVERGELLCLLGPSGCGKTTILRVLGGFLRPTAGLVTLDGQDITRLPPETRPVSTVFQSYALFPHLSVAENVAYGLSCQGVPARERRLRAQEQLEQVGMAEHADARVSELSGGQQQRVALARSLVLRPKLLLLDEPLSNLDAALRLRLRTEVRELQREAGVTMVFVTHDREEALVVGDRLAIMRDGGIRQLARADEAYDHPVDAYCARFLGGVNDLVGPDGRVHHFRHDAVVMREDGGGQWEGRVADVRFLGPSYEYALDVGDTRVTLRCPRTIRLERGACASFDIARELHYRNEERQHEQYRH